MAIFKRPDAELYYEVHGSGFPLLLFAAGGLRSQAAYWKHSPSDHPAVTSAEIERLAPNLEVQKDWRAPEHLAESIKRVSDFLTRHTPAG